MADFQPNRSTLEEGIAHVKDVMGSVNFPTDRITTSRQGVSKSTRKALDVSNVPSGFTKWQIPAMFDGPTLMYMSVGSPGTHVPEHSHDEGSGMRVIVSGSIKFGDDELTAGDWMFIPRGNKYSFEVGDMGATMFYCYQCSCR